MSPRAVRQESPKKQTRDDLDLALSLLVRWKANQLNRNARGEGCPQGVFDETTKLLERYGVDIRLRVARDDQGTDQ